MSKEKLSVPYDVINVLEVAYNEEGRRCIREAITNKVLLIPTGECNSEFLESLCEAYRGYLLDEYIYE